MTVVNTLEAKTQFSRLIAMAQRGEEVVVARAGVPVVRLVPVRPPIAREFGFDPSVSLPDDSPFFDELPAEELARWE
ncbi:MAG: type II toxin-antitoxin system prevent-host-death family antitoxin [Propionibacteriaceae bacterium]|jgi:prevent-host-death family protein|nr:type II toxin-antitoxin system prevent-host-death family antitoxin [Propionibacteriaceae bacterium]